MSLPTISAALVAALIQVESHGNDYAVGDHGLAFGCLQVRQEVLDDVCRLSGVNLRLQDMFERRLAVSVCAFYLGHYGNDRVLGHVATDEDLARIWNGGPDGWKQTATVAYWGKVKLYLGVQITPNPDVSDDGRAFFAALASHVIGKVGVPKCLSHLEPGHVPTDSDQTKNHPAPKTPQGPEQSGQSKGTGRGSS